MMGVIVHCLSTQVIDSLVNICSSYALVVGHAGHGEIPGYSNNGAVYSLEDQINHKSKCLNLRRRLLTVDSFSCILAQL